MLTLLKSGTKPALIFFPESVKIIGAVHLDMLEKNVLLWLKICYVNKSYIFQQDAHAHASSKVQQRCKENVSGF